jgi:hypothetical protein
MPEDIEVDTDKLRETIDEEAERYGGLNRKVGLTTALFAALAAVAALKAGATVNEALVLKTEATGLQAQASDQWAYYQAKGIKAVATRSDTAAARYVSEQGPIRQKAAALEKERDARSREADQLLHKHHRFADAVALLQVAIALGAVAALTRLPVIWLASLAAGLGGAGLFLASLLG